MAAYASRRRRRPDGRLQGCREAWLAVVLSMMAIVFCWVAWLLSGSWANCLRKEWLLTEVLLKAGFVVGRAGLYVAAAVVAVAATSH